MTAAGRGDDMDISNDAVRRALRDIDAQHRLELGPTGEAIDRLYKGEAPAQTKWDVLTGGANRATWMRVGGVAVLAGAVLAACGDNTDTKASPTTAAPAGATTTLANGSRIDPNDLMVLRFSASLENLAVAAYGMGAPLITTPALQAVAKLFQSHHKEHALLFNGQLTANGQKAFTEPNPALLQTLKPQIDALKTEADVLRFAQTLELAAASTYFSTVGALKGEKLAYTAMTIGGTEYRHAALLAFVNNAPIASTASGFLTTSEAFTPQGV
jgi:hypothetical protein